MDLRRFKKVEVDLRSLKTLNSRFKKIEYFNYATLPHNHLKIFYAAYSPFGCVIHSENQNLNVNFRNFYIFLFNLNHHGEECANCYIHCITEDLCNQ